MLTNYKVNQILNLVKNKYFDLLNDEIIFVKKSNEFSFSTIVNTYDIEFMPEFQKDKFSDYLQSFLNTKLKDTFYNLAPNLLETFALLHEIGHLMDHIINGRVNNAGYEEYKNKQYISVNEAMTTYRKIPAEVYADNFSINFINENIKSLWYILDPNANPEEVDFFTSIE